MNEKGGERGKESPCQRVAQTPSRYVKCSGEACLRAVVDARRHPVVDASRREKNEPLNGVKGNDCASR